MSTKVTMKTTVTIEMSKEQLECLLALQRAIKTTQKDGRDGWEIIAEMTDGYVANILKFLIDEDEIVEE